MSKRYYFVYIVCNKYKTTLYVGLTNDLTRRLTEHNSNIVNSFSTRYKCRYLVHYEKYDNINLAINREKQIKKWGRRNKMQLIEKYNPDWNFLNELITRVDKEFL